MKHIIIASILATLPLTAAEADQSKPAKPRIEVCFVLDTTGSMGGLIAAAKQKIWGIANDIISAKPTPEVRFGLIGYRDRGDDYLTRRVELTDDLDAVYAKLNEFQAKGGGDWPESVSEALDEAVEKIEWSADKAVLKIIYLVGDAPPQNYKDGKDWQKVCEAAVRRDLIINTVQCGSAKDTAAIWQAIAGRAEGQYVALSQDGNVAVIAAPQDKELAELSIRLGTTLIACGDEKTRRLVVAKQARADDGLLAAGGADAAPAAATSTAAERVSFNFKSGKAVQGEGELLDALKEGKLTLDEVKMTDLPEDLQKLSREELKAHVARKQAEREEIQKKIAGLSKARDAYIAAEREKLAREKGADSFDTQVSKILRAQAARKGIRYE